MIEELKELTEYQTLQFFDEDIIEFVGAEEANVTSVRFYMCDDGEIVMLEFDDFMLAAHNFSSEPCYFIYQITDSGKLETLEKEGFECLNEDLDFRNKIVIRDDDKPTVYKHSDVGAIYDLNADDERASISICEYKSGNYLSHILIEKTEEDETCLTIYQGFEIYGDAFDSL